MSFSLFVSISQTPDYTSNRIKTQCAAAAHLPENNEPLRTNINVVHTDSNTTQMFADITRL